MRTNRWLIVFSVIAIFCLLIGGGFVLVGQAMGGHGQFRNVGKWNVDLGPLSIGTKRYDGPLDNKTVMLEEFSSLVIDLSMVEIEIKKGAAASLELIDIPADTLKTSQEGTALRIYNTYERNVDYQLGHITNKVVLTLPEMEYAKIDIDLSMGILTIVSINTKALTIQSSMTAIDINDLTSQGLDIESSMADVDVSGQLKGITNIENSMGNVEITVLGNKVEYGYDLSNSMGAMNYDGKSLDGLSAEWSGNESAANQLYVDNSMGNIDIRFR